jgi:glycosyltransferase involved in cell wall biosynthesis
MRCSCAILQPSLFEGWGLSVQEARALGRPVICSNIPALREHAPDALGFFDPCDPRALATLLEQVWAGHEPGPNMAAEAAALAAHRAFGLRQGQALLEICK